MNPICFFDMDKTLIAGNSGVSFMRYSLRRGKTTRWKVLKSLINYLLYRYDLLDMDRAYRKTLRPLAGVREEELIQFCREWFEDAVRSLIYPQAQDFVRHHLKRGERVVIISNSTTYTVAPLAQHLEIPHILGTQLEVYRGVLRETTLSPSASVRERFSGPKS